MLVQIYNWRNHVFMINAFHVKVKKCISIISWTYFFSFICVKFCQWDKTYWLELLTDIIIISCKNIVFQQMTTCKLNSSVNSNLHKTPHPGASKQIKFRQKATLRSQCFANRAQSAIIRTFLLLYRMPCADKKYKSSFCTQRKP